MPSRSVRGSKSYSVLINPTWKKSPDDLYRQDHLSPSTDSPSLCLPNRCQPDLRPKAKRFAAYQKLFPATRTQAYGTAGRHVSGIDKDRDVLIRQKEVLGDRAEELTEQEFKSQSSTTTSLESLHLHEDCEPSLRDPSSLETTPSPAVAFATLPYTIPKSMGNNASGIAKRDRGRQANSPATDTSERTSSSPRRLPTPQNVSPIRLLLGKASISTLHLHEKPRNSKVEHSPTRLTRLKEYSIPGIDPTATLSPVSPGGEAPLLYPSLSVSAATSDHSTITQGTAHAHSPPPTTFTLSPPSSSHALSPPLSANTSSRPSTATSQNPSSIYSPFTRQQTPIPITAPPIGLTHFNCYQSHRRVLKLPNKHYPVPCMICKVDNTEQRWKCAWCCLRVCTECMDALRKVEGKDLRVVVRALQEKKENHWTAMGGQRDNEDVVKRNNIKDLEASEGTLENNGEAKKRRRMGRVPFP